MADLLQDGALWLEKQRHDQLTRTVTYRRDSATKRLKATVGKTTFRTDDGYGLIKRIVSRDFLIRAKDLKLNGQKELPKRGDEILEKQGRITYVHEVMAPGNEPEWRWSDSNRVTLRIHTKQTGTE